MQKNIFTRFSIHYNKDSKQTRNRREFLQPQSESESEVAQPCLTLCHPVDCSLPGSSVHGILQARILEWVATSFFRGSSWPRDQTQVSRIAGRHFNLWATGEAPTSKGTFKKSIPNIILHSKGLILSSKTRSTTHHCIGESKQRS